MKFTLFLLLFAAGAAAADFSAAQAARLVIGQPNFTIQDPAPTDVVIGSPAGIAYAANKLFVADSNMMMVTPVANRVLIYNDVSSQIPAPTDQLAQNSLCPACVGKASVVLGQTDFTTITASSTQTARTLRAPTSVASDGIHLAVADAGNNRVLIWNHIPATNGEPADVVVGQPSFSSAAVSSTHAVTAASLLEPQGVWIQNGKLYIADTGNNRILIYNRIPTANGAAADMVLGQPNLTAYTQIGISEQTTAATATNMLNPVSVTTDGTHLFVADLGFNRTLVWNTLPTSNGAAASFALGQPDMVSSIANNAYSTDANNNYKETPVLCTTSIGVDTNSNPIYPGVCASTLNFPRFALSAGGRLFVADGGNDRILVYQTMPTASGAPADLVLGQEPDYTGVNVNTNAGSNAVDSLRTPASLAWDGTNLYVADVFNRRISVFSIGENNIPSAGVRNGASFAVYATGAIKIAGSIKAGDIVTVTISFTVNNVTKSSSYTYTVQASDTLQTVVTAVANAINSSNSGAGDPYAIATAEIPEFSVNLQAKKQGPEGDYVSYSVALSSGAVLSAQGAGGSLTGGADASQIAPGTLVSIFANPNTVLSYAPAQSADMSKTQLPNELGGVQVYINGFRAPLLYVSPTQINSQIPWEMDATSSVSVYVRLMKPDGSVVATTPVAVTIVPANPGLFTYSDSQQVVAQHAFSQAAGIVSVDGGVTPGDGGVVQIRGRRYTYTVQINDTLKTIAQGFADLINAQDPEVYAVLSSEYTRIMLFARIAGLAGDGIPYTAGVTVAPTAQGGALVLTPFGSNLCCANYRGALVTLANPALADEFIYVYATGIGEAVYTPAGAAIYKTGYMFPADSPVTTPLSAPSAAAARITADVIEVTPLPGSFGVFRVLLHLNSGLSPDPAMTLTLAQNGILSNVTTMPLASTKYAPPTTTTSSTTSSNSKSQ